MDRHSDSTAAHGHDHSAHAHHAHHHEPVHQHHHVPPNQVAAAAAGTIYTCPMHPEVRQSRVVWGLKKLNANIRKTPEFRTTRLHRP